MVKQFPSIDTFLSSVDKNDSNSVRQACFGNFPLSKLQKKSTDDDSKNSSNTNLSSEKLIKEGSLKQNILNKEKNIMPCFHQEQKIQDQVSAPQVFPKIISFSSETSFQNKLFILLKWIAEAFPLTIHYFFQYKYPYIKDMIPVTSRELSRFSRCKFVYFMTRFEMIFKSIISRDDIFILLEFSFQHYKRPNMKTVIKNNLDAFYSIGFKSFFPPYQPFETMLKQIKEFD
jgi:hypothetical protein